MATETDPLLSREVDRPKADSEDSRRQVDVPRRTRYLILAGVWAATFISSLNWTLVPTMLPSITSDFKSSHQSSWVGTAYLLATCTFTPLYGRLCNVMGRRGANQTAVFFAALGTLVCGLSTNMNMLVAARFVAGIGGGGIFTTCSVIISDLYSLRSRGVTQGIASVFVGLGMGLGGPWGAAVTDWLGWRWAFLLQLPMFFTSFVLTSISLHYATPGKGRSKKEMLKRVDYGGSVLLLIAIGSFLILLSNKVNDLQPWSSPRVYIPLALFMSGTLTFFLFEFFLALEPIFPLFMIKQPVPIFVGTSNFLVATCTFTVFFFYPMWFQTVLLTSPSVAGLHLLPNAVCLPLGSLFSGVIIHRTGKYKILNLICGIFPFIAALLMSSMRPDSSWVKLWFSIIPMGFGNAIILQVMLVALLAHLPPRDMAVGTGFAHLFECMGQVCGVAISYAVFQATLDQELVKRITGLGAEEIIIQIRQSARLVHSLPPGLQHKAQEAYAVSIRMVFYFAASTSVIAYIIRLGVGEKSLGPVQEPPPQAGTQIEPAQVEA